MRAFTAAVAGRFLQKWEIQRVPSSFTPFLSHANFYVDQKPIKGNEVDRIERLRLYLDLKESCTLGNDSKTFIVVTGRFFSKTVCQIIKCFPQAIINRANDRQIFFASAFISLMAGGRRVNFCLRASLSEVSVARLMLG